MRFFDRLIKDSKVRPQAVIYSPSIQQIFGNDVASTLPEEILRLIFSYVCPHASYVGHRSWDDENGDDKDCMLCQTRDLARCIRVCKGWCTPAQNLLYENIKIDISHSCHLQDIPRRSKGSRPHFRSTVAPKDPVQERLQLLTRTQQENSALGQLTKCLKIPWMIRDTFRADLARAVSALPSLQYVDLPTGDFDDIAADAALNEELSRNCPDLRKMRYNHGSAEGLSKLINSTPWPKLEVLELNTTTIESDTLLLVLASLPSLVELSVLNLPNLNDTLLTPSLDHPPFPSLVKLTIEGNTNLTPTVLSTYISNPPTNTTLTSLSLLDTTIPIESLHTILSAATALKEFKYQHTIPTTPNSSNIDINTKNLPPLKSQSLQTLYFEILPPTTSTSPNTKPPQREYYEYLARSLTASHLPALSKLYIRGDYLPNLLTSSPHLRIYTRPVFALDMQWKLSSGVDDHNDSKAGLGLGGAEKSGYGVGNVVVRKGCGSGEWRDSFRPATRGDGWMGAGY